MSFAKQSFRSPSIALGIDGNDGPRMAVLLALFESPLCLLGWCA